MPTGRSGPCRIDGSPVMCTIDSSSVGTLTSSRAVAMVSSSSVIGTPANRLRSATVVAARYVLAMAHPGIDTIRAFLAGLDLSAGTIEERRAGMEATGVGPEALIGVRVEPDTVAGRPAERVVPDGGT